MDDLNLWDDLEERKITIPYWEYRGMLEDGFRIRIMTEMRCQAILEGDYQSASKLDHLLNTEDIQEAKEIRADIEFKEQEQKLREELMSKAHEEVPQEKTDGQ